MMTKPDGYEGHYADRATELDAEMEEMRVEFDEWLQNDEQLNGCRGLSNLEKEQMFAAWHARQKEIDALRAIIKEAQNQAPVAWAFGVTSGDLYGITLHKNSDGLEPLYAMPYIPTVEQYKLIGYIEPTAPIEPRGAERIYIVGEDGFDGCTVPVFVRAKDE